MDQKELRIVFLGTPEFAVASLKALIDAKYNIVGVITAPDRKGGRGRKKIITSAVKTYALNEGLTILQPTNLKDEDFQRDLRSLGANVQVVVAFRMLPRAVWDMPEYGTYNLHGSLLPKYRGAAPINWAIMNGEEYTGVTTFKLKHEIDTGNIALQAKVQIKKDDYLDDVHDKMMEVGAQLVIQTMSELSKGRVILKEQEQKAITKAPKIFHNNCEIDWGRSPEDIYHMIRGLSPYPVAWTTIMGKKIKIYKATYSYHKHDHPIGSYISDGKSYLAVRCKNGIISIEALQLEGKKCMNVKDYLNGVNLKENKQQLPIKIQPRW